MSSSLPLLLFLVVAGGLIFANICFARKRREELSAFYSTRGFAFDAAGYRAADLPYGSLGLFSKGGHVNNVGRRACRSGEFLVFDYTYHTGSGKNRHTHRLTVACTGSGAQTPEFTVAPENVFSKIAQAVGYKDIDFAHDDAFSKMFVVRGADPGRIQNALSAPLMSLFKANPKLHFECGPAGAACFLRRRMRVDELSSFIELSERVFSQLAL